MNIRLLRLLGLGLALLLLHTLVTVLPVAARPDFVLVLTLALGLRGGAIGGLVLAFGLGFSVDVLSGSPLGLYALLRGTSCAATRLFDRALYLRASLPWIIYAAGYAMVDLLLLGLTLRLMVPDGAIPWNSLLMRAPLSACLTAALAVPVLWVVQRMDSESPGAKAWTALSSRART